MKFKVFDMACGCLGPHYDLVSNPIESGRGLFEMVLPCWRHSEESLVDLPAQVVQVVLNVKSRRCRLEGAIEVSQVKQAQLRLVQTHDESLKGSLLRCRLSHDRLQHPFLSGTHSGPSEEGDAQSIVNRSFSMFLWI